MKFRGSKKIKFSIQQVYKKQTNKTKYCLKKQKNRNSRKKTIQILNSVGIREAN